MVGQSKWLSLTSHLYQIKLILTNKKNAAALSLWHNIFSNDWNELNIWFDAKSREATVKDETISDANGYSDFYNAKVK